MDSLLEQLTPLRLTEILHAHGYLDRGQVLQVEVAQVFETPPSFHARLRLSYSPDASAEAPRLLFLKSPKPHKLARGKREVDFYSRLASLMPDAALLPCYAAEWSPATGESFLLLADVSPTHITADLPLSWLQLATMAQTLAALHACWWEHPTLVDLVGEAPETHFAVDFAECAGYYAELQANLGDQLTPSQRRIFENFLAHGPDLILPRIRQSRALTLSHPENHNGNILFPVEESGTALLIDWHQYRCWWGVGDLVSVIDRCLSEEQRERSHELVAIYYRGLVQGGVSGYSWQQCWDDYRLGLVGYLVLLLQFRTNRAWLLRHLGPMEQEFERAGCGELFAAWY
ncbi:MAG: phosphotransferase [Chloroflexi bacterium]|nr:phosphotransferase [Chloroflexota bacterium]